MSQKQDRRSDRSHDAVRERSVSRQRGRHVPRDQGQRGPLRVWDRQRLLRAPDVLRRPELPHRPPRADLRRGGHGDRRLPDSHRCRQRPEPADLHGRQDRLARLQLRRRLGDSREWRGLLERERRGALRRPRLRLLGQLHARRGSALVSRRRKRARDPRRPVPAPEHRPWMPDLARAGRRHQQQRCRLRRRGRDSAQQRADAHREALRQKKKKKKKCKKTKKKGKRATPRPRPRRSARRKRRSRKGNGCPRSSQP